MERKLLSFEEMLVRIEASLKSIREEKEKAEKIYMPQIVLNKLEEEVVFWESVFTAVEEYKNWVSQEKANIDTYLANLTEGPRVTVDDNGEEQWVSPIARDIVNDAAPSVDMVNSPNHYAGEKKFEVIDVIKDWLTEDEFQGYIKGNIIKYVARERLKNGDEDMYKALFYLNYLMNGEKSDGRKNKI